MRYQIRIDGGSNQVATTAKSQTSTFEGPDNVVPSQFQPSSHLELVALNCAADITVFIPDN